MTKQNEQNGPAKSRAKDLLLFIQIDKVLKETSAPEGSKK